MDAHPHAEALAQVAADFAARPLIPSGDTAPTLHVGNSDLPFVEAGDGSAIQLLHVDLLQGLWISKVRLPPGYRVATHYHTGFVYAVTLQGRWFYDESPEAVCAPGSYLFEPAGSVHTLRTPEDQDGETLVWFAISGANINLDAGGGIVSIIDARRALELYRAVTGALGQDTSRLIVVGA